VDGEQHFDLLRQSAAEVKELQDQPQSIRDQEAALQAQRVAALAELKQARDLRFERMTAAIDDRVPKAQIARELGDGPHQPVQADRGQRRRVSNASLERPGDVGGRLSWF
jgi:hypothetical protein